MAKKIYDEMREIAADKTTSNSTLLRLLTTAIADLTEQVEVLLSKNISRDREIEVISNSITDLKNITKSNSDNITSIKDNLLIRIGVFLQSHIKTSVILLLLIILIALHSIGIEFSIVELFDDLKTFVGLIL